MKKLFIFTLSMGFCISLFSQISNWHSPYQPVFDKGFQFYKTQTGKFLEQNNFRWAAANAVSAVSATDKPKKQQKVLDLLDEILPLAFSSSLEIIDRYNGLAAKETGIKKANYLYEITRVYGELIPLYREVQAQPSTQKLAKKDKTIRDYSPELLQAEEELQHTKLAIAEEHYNNALKINASPDDHWLKRLAYGRAFKVAYTYQPEYKDVAQQLQTAKKSILVKVSKIQNHTNYSPGRNLSMNELISNTWRNFDFVKLDKYSNLDKTDIIIECNINEVNFDTQYLDPSNDKKSKIVDKKREIIAKGVLTTHKRVTQALVDYSYTIIDLITEEELDHYSAEKPFEVHSSTWYSFKGDRRVLSKSELQDLKNYYSPSPLPYNNQLFTNSLEALQNHLNNEITSFVVQYAY